MKPLAVVVALGLVTLAACGVGYTICACWQQLTRRPRARTWQERQRDDAADTARRLRRRRQDKRDDYRTTYPWWV